MSALLEGRRASAWLALGTVTAALAAALTATVAVGDARADDDAVVTGTVFADRNGDGDQDRGETGLAGVSVSDGVTIVRTDQRGRYSLETDPARRTLEIVFVSQPAGYEAPPDEAMTPRFYRDLGELEAGERASADFGLRESPRSRTRDFTFGLLADPQSLNFTDEGRAIFEDLVGELNVLTAKPDFLMVAGDLTDEALDEEFVRYKATTGTSRVPVWPAVGNHDFYDSATYDNYREHLGPEWYSFDHGGRHFVILENTSGFADPAQLEWMRQDLALNAGGGKDVVVMVHRPMNTPATGGGGNSPAPYIELMEQYDVKLVLAGHTHRNDVDLSVVGGAAHVVTNSIATTSDAEPNGFRVVSFDGRKVDYGFKMYGVARALTITSPAPGSTVSADTGTIQVNAYNTTTTVTDVSYRIDRGPWRKLRQSSDFTWAAPARSRDLTPGRHTMDVQVSDDGGQAWTESSTFTVVPAAEVAVPRDGSPWSMFKGGPSYTGLAADVLAPTLQPAWSYRTPGSILTSSPVIADGVVYAGTRDENSETHRAVHAVDLATGAPLWSFRTDGDVEGTPVVAEGRVYASTVRGTLYALDAGTGEKLWSVTKGDDQADGVHRGWMYEPPNYADGIVYQVYSMGDRRLMALDAATGAALWDVRLNSGWIAETAPTLGGGRAYVAGDGSWMVAVDARTGAELWRRPSGVPCRNTTPAYSGELLYLGCTGDDLIALNAATGQEVWRYSSPDASLVRGTPTGSSPAVADGVAYLGFSNGNVTALDARTGALLWTHRTGGGITSSPVVSGSTVYVGSNDGFAYGFDRATGATRWSFEIGTWVASSPAISGNTLVIGAFDGNLYAFTATED